MDSEQRRDTEKKWKSITNTSNRSLKSTHSYLLQLKRLKIGRRRDIRNRDRKMEVIDEGQYEHCWRLKLFFIGKEIG